MVLAVVGVAVEQALADLTPSILDVAELLVRGEERDLLFQAPPRLAGALFLVARELQFAGAAGAGGLAADGRCGGGGGGFVRDALLLPPIIGL